MKMIYIPAGEFLMDSDDFDADAYDDEKPQHHFYLDSYWIDVTEVTNAKYALCVDSSYCIPPYETVS